MPQITPKKLFRDAILGVYPQIQGIMGAEFTLESCLDELEIAYSAPRKYHDWRHIADFLAFLARNKGKFKRSGASLSYREAVFSAIYHDFAIQTLDERRKSGPSRPLSASGLPLSPHLPDPFSDESALRALQRAEIPDQERDSDEIRSAIIAISRAKCLEKSLRDSSGANFDQGDALRVDRILRAIRLTNPQTYEGGALGFVTQGEIESGADEMLLFADGDLNCFQDFELLRQAERRVAAEVGMTMRDFMPLRLAFYERVMPLRPFRSPWSRELNERWESIRESALSRV